MSIKLQAVRDWLTMRGWRAARFQAQTWRALLAGHSGLLHADTGSGKTYALWLGALAAWADPSASPLPARGGAARAQPLRVLWLTPMRALAADTEQALREPMAQLAPDWSLGRRTSDTGSALRAAQARRLPTTLVTTPESLSLLLARADAPAQLGRVQLVVVDEWHELLGSKRGVQVQLALARLRGWNPALQVWGISATLSNLDEAMAALLGPEAARRGHMVQGPRGQPPVIDTLLPEHPERFAWSGHLGRRMVPRVAAALDDAGTALVFTNTRAQAEQWYQALLQARPAWAGLIALHHGSLDAGVRTWVENGLRDGSLKVVVCTSSLDLGVDFLPVQRVLQIGSVRSVARLLQRAGRSGHAPGRRSRITLVPTNALELIEAAAARDAVQAGAVEARSAPRQPLDVLVQHLVTAALGGGFVPDALYAEVRGTHAYRDLAGTDWQWCLDFVRCGGASLTAYPEYRRVVPDEAGVWRVPDARLARRHRNNIGTIVSEVGITVKYWQRGGAGATLGTLEESFIARLAPGEVFLFAGRALELVRVEQMTAYVRRAAAGRPAVPRWQGGRLPVSAELAGAMLQRLTVAARGQLQGPEMRAAAALLAVQQEWSHLPVAGQLLIETLRTREGSHLFLYPFAGRVAHLGLASLLAWRIGSLQPASFSLAVNDYGLELLSAQPLEWRTLLDAGLFDEVRLEQDVLASLNAGELARRRFREIARIAGLVVQGPPHARQSSRQLQASSALFYDVFSQYDADNLLLAQARREVLAQELDAARLRMALQQMRAAAACWVHLSSPSPFAFALMVERLRERLSTEKLGDRVARMLAQLETAAGAHAGDLPAEPPSFGLGLPESESRQERRRRR